MNSRNPLVSIIIPAYNTGHYIGETLECTINQTYQNTEIIVIDDGSTDNTREIVRHYQALDKRITLLENERGGVSRARNLGIDHSKGEYLFFWDSDDIIDPDLIRKTIDFRRDNGVESVLFGWANYIEGVKQDPEVHQLKTIYKGNEIVNNLIPHFIGHSFDEINSWIKNKRSLREGKESTAVWRLVFDANVIKKYGIRFDNNLSLGEDTKFINEYFLYSTSVGFTDECLYFLRKRSDSANMTSLGNPQLMAKNKTKLIYAREELDQIALEQKGKKLIEYWNGTMVFSVMELGIRLSQCKTDRAENRKIFMTYCRLPEVKRAIAEFHPSIGLKGIPFIMVKHRMARLMYSLFSLIPPQIVDRFTN